MEALTSVQSPVGSSLYKPEVILVPIPFRHRFAAAAGGTSYLSDALMYRKWAIRMDQVCTIGNVFAKSFHSITQSGCERLPDIDLLAPGARGRRARHGGRLQCTFPHLPAPIRLHIRWCVELISRGYDAAEHSRALEDDNGIQSGSRCSPDIAFLFIPIFFPFAPQIRIQIQIQI